MPSKPESPDTSPTTCLLRVGHPAAAPRSILLSYPTSAAKPWYTVAIHDTDNGIQALIEEDGDGNQVSRYES